MPVSLMRIETLEDIARAFKHPAIILYWYSSATILEHSKPSKTDASFGKSISDSPVMQLDEIRSHGAVGDSSIRMLCVVGSNSEKAVLSHSDYITINLRPL